MVQTPGGLHYKSLLSVVIDTKELKAGVFVTVSHFRPSLIFVGRLGAWSSIHSTYFLCNL